jgi:Rab GDP dissociation inhibitor
MYHNLTYDNLFQCRKYGLEDDTIDIIGHALALQIDDSYLDQPAMDFVKRMKVQLIFLHFFSICCYCFYPMHQKLYLFQSNI